MSSFKYFASVLAIVKDEPDLEEWIAYHRLLGFDHFFLYDNDSKPPLSQILGKYSSFITVKHFPGSKVQEAAYQDFLECQEKATEWLAVIDADEFLRLKKHSTIKDFLLSSPIIRTLIQVF